MNECLEYFEAAILHPQSVQGWNDWWRENETLVGAAFSREDYLRLKFRKLDAARAIILESIKYKGLPQPPRPSLASKRPSEPRKILGNHLFAWVVDEFVGTKRPYWQRLAICAGISIAYFLVLPTMAAKGLEGWLAIVAWPLLILSVLVFAPLDRWLFPSVRDQLKKRYPWLDPESSRVAPPLTQTTDENPNKLPSAPLES